MMHNLLGKRRITPRRRKSRRVRRPQGIIPLIFWGLGARRVGLPIVAIIIFMVIQQTGYVLPAIGLPPTSGQIVTVAYISDGDTLAAYNANGEKLRIRLAGIDAPEKDQPWGLESKAYLMQLLPKDTEIRVETVDQDRYGRTVGRVWKAATDLNAEQIRTGNAWVYRLYNDSAADLAPEETTRKSQIGLWKYPSPTPPWVWRKRQRTKQAAK